MGCGLCLGLLYHTSAYFDDTEASPNNSFEVGIWILEVDGGGETGMYLINEPDPGTIGTQGCTLTNVGNVYAYVNLEDIGLSVSGTGELNNHVTVHLFVDDNGNGLWDVGETSIYGTDADMESINAIIDVTDSYNLDLRLEPGESNSIVLAWKVDGAYEPGEFGGDEVELDILFDISPLPRGWEPG
jgi:hypothetical protein